MLPTPAVVAGTTAELLRQELAAAHLLLGEARRRYTEAGVKFADRLSASWLARTENPYLAELERLAGILGEPGLAMLNLSYEWGCTTGLDSVGGRMLRTLDWPFDGLGRHVAVLKTRGPAGRYASVTWPGFAGVLTAVAPGRFAAAINQAKDWNGRLTRALAWPFARLAMLRSDALPPAHLLRRVCEEARDFASAARMLAETPVCLPVFFSLLGPKPGEGCLIERLPTAARVHPAPIVVANHWRFPGLRGERPPLTARLDGLSRYTGHSVARERALGGRLLDARGFDWLQPPVMCGDTRFACALDPRHGTIALMGVERGAQATEIVSVTA